MWTHEAKNLAHDLFQKHGLRNWRFSLVRIQPPAIAIACWDRQIHLSVGHARIFSEEVLKPILLHEVAHALVGIDHAHDDVWRIKAYDIGGIDQPSVTLPQKAEDQAYLLNKSKYRLTKKVWWEDDGKVVRGRRLRARLVP